MSKIALIFGISGQDGAYLAELLLNKGYYVHGTSRDAEMAAFSSLEKLRIKNKITFHSVALNDFRSTLKILEKVNPDEVYNLAGQSSVGLSFEQPIETLESIANMISVSNMDMPFGSILAKENFDVFWNQRLTKSNQ